MADPIRQPVHPPRSQPPVRVRPRRALHRTLAVPEETESVRTVGPPPQPVRPVPAPRPEQARPAHPAPAPEPREKASVSLPKAAPSERKLRIPLLTALGLHLTVLLLSLLLATGARLAPADLLLAAAVIGSGGIMLAVGARWGRRG